MKVLIIRNYPSYVDVKHNTYNIQEVGLAKALIKKGNKTDIVFWTDKEEKEEIIQFDDKYEFKVFYRKGKNILKNAWYSHIDQLISNYDIIQCCEYNQIQSWYWAKKYKNKTIIYHGPYYSKFNKRYNLICKIFDVFFLKRYIKLNTKFIVKSELARQFLLNKGIDNDNICVAGVGIDTEVLKTENKCEIDLYNDMKKDKSELKLLYIGKIEPRRNPKFLIDILKKLIEKNCSVHLYIIGNGESKYVHQINEYAKKYNKYITWIDRCEQRYLSSIYEQADVFLLPTSYEIFGMVLLEAMYYGCIVITTNNGGSSTLIENYKDGIIIDDMKSLNWADEIIKIKGNKEALEKMSLEAKNKISNKYLWDNLVNTFLKQYTKFMKKD